MWWRKQEQSPPKVVPLPLKFAFGSISGMVSTVLIHPADLVKTRMQLLGQDGPKISSFKIVQGIVQSKGLRGMYDGLSAALFRQMVSSGARLGCFNAMFDWHVEKYGIPNLSTKLMMGSTAGFFSALIAMPSDVALVRMTADGRLPKYRRKNYKNVFNCIYRLVRVEGFGVLTRGLFTSLTRSMLLNGAQLGAYCQVREMLMPQLGNDLKLHFSASMIAGFITTIMGQPVDLIKTRIQDAGKKTNPFTVVMEIIKREGVLSFWNGFLLSYLKAGPHTVITFILLEQLSHWYLNLDNKNVKQ